MENILFEQNPHWRNLSIPSVKRESLKQLIDYLPLRQIITISGIRRCGKSTLARQAIDHLIESGVSANNILFVNLEQPFFLEYRHDANYLNTLFETYLKLMNPQGRVYIIFDEIQFFENWQVYIKSKYETKDEKLDLKFIITGSNSSMLSNDMNTLLSGRSLNIHLQTFSFTEFLNYKGIHYATKLERLENRIEIARAKDEYLQWGGFYEVFNVDGFRNTETEQIKKDILVSYAKNIIYQDIVPRYSIRNSETLERLFFYLLSHTGAVLNYTTLSQIFGVSDKSIKEYLNYFEDVFLLQRIDKFHNKPKERIKSPKKIYALDNGFLQIAPRHSKNLGASLENFVFTALYQNNPHLSYLKDTYEIDFYSKGDYYQVAYDISDQKTLKRELNAFRHFKITDYDKCKLITYDQNDKSNEIEIMSVEQFIFTCRK